MARDARISTPPAGGGNRRKKTATGKPEVGSGSQQGALPGFGPAAIDDFQFTWWTTPEGARVWVEVRGAWVPGTVIGRGNERVTVEIESARGRSKVRRRYDQLHRRVDDARKPAPPGRKR